MSPDCQQGKHTACTGDDWNHERDERQPCPCDCHVHYVPGLGWGWQPS